MHQTIVIVGAGFCGSVLAANLLRSPGRRDIVLIERGASIGRGVAYASHDVPYVLNVPAGRLSVQPGDPLHFLRYVRQSHPDADADGFVSMPNVFLPIEMVNLMTASRAYEANLRVMQTLRQQLEQSLTLLR